jgi:ABC-2 family transporter protein
MIWLTWRQHRKMALYTLIALAAVAAVMLPTGLEMHHTFTKSGLAACLTKLGTAPIAAANTPDCGTLSQQFEDQYRSLTFVAILFVILPVFVGIFFGAPVVAREVEAGTHRFVWTQGISRRHWALVKIGLLGTVTLILATAYALGVSWWFSPLVTNGGGRLGPVSFDVQGIAPIGYTLFAVALGILASTISKKTLPAMGVTLAGFVVVRILIETLARPHYRTPLTASIPITSTGQFNQALRRLDLRQRGDQRRRQTRHAELRHQLRRTRWQRGSRRRSPVRLRPLQRWTTVPGPRPRTVLQLAAIPTRQQILGIPEHRNRHLPRPDRHPALPRHPPHPAHLLTQQTPSSSWPPRASDVINLDTAFGQQFLHVPVGQAVARIPAHRHREHVGWDPEARERRPGHRQRTQAS